MRKSAALMIISFILPAFVYGAENPRSTTAGLDFKARGYLYILYSYIGSASTSNVYSGLRLTGSFQLSAFSDKITLRYRSQHWINFERTQNSVLESPYENRHIIQIISLEAKNLIANGLRVRFGRIYPELDYGSTPLVDGGSFRWDFGGFSVNGSAGRMVDLWNGTQDGTDLLGAFGLKYRSRGFSASAGISSASYFGLKQKEIPAGFNLELGKSVWAEAYAGYDLERSDLARAGMSVSWRGESVSFSLNASQWKNPFDQLTLVDKTKSIAYWGLYSKDVPATYRDIRLSGSYGRGSWGVRGSLGYMSGVRSGWLGSGYIALPPLLGVQLTFGGQAMKSDFIEFYSMDVQANAQIQDFALRLESQTRYYQWLPRDSGFHNLDNFSMLTVEYPLLRHFYLSAAGGGFFRKLGNESFKPEVELRLIVRI